MNWIISFVLFAGFGGLLNAQCPSGYVVYVGNNTLGCGCATACFDAGVCPQAATGNCPEVTVNGTIEVPNGCQASIHLRTPDCSGSGPGLDAGDSFDYNNGEYVLTGGGDANINYDDFVSNNSGVTLTVPFTIISNRSDEKVEVTVSYTILPVEISNVSLEKDNESLFLCWTTATEINNSHFDIEYSTGMGKFNYIKSIDGSGNAISSINYKTEVPFKRTGNNYYRLKQVDFDGNYSYSKILSFTSNNDNKPNFFVSIDNSEGVYLRVKGNPLAYEKMVCYDITGRRILEKNLKLEENQISLEDPNLKGMVVVSLIGYGKVISKKLFIP